MGLLDFMTGNNKKGDDTQGDTQQQGQNPVHPQQQASGSQPIYPRQQNPQSLAGNIPGMVQSQNMPQAQNFQPQPQQPQNPMQPLQPLPQQRMQQGQQPPLNQQQQRQQPQQPPAQQPQVQQQQPPIPQQNQLQQPTGGVSVQSVESVDSFDTRDPNSFMQEIDNADPTVNQDDTDNGVPDYTQGALQPYEPDQQIIMSNADDNESDSENDLMDETSTSDSGMYGDTSSQIQDQNTDSNTQQATEPALETSSESTTASQKSPSDFVMPKIDFSMLQPDALQKKASVSSQQQEEQTNTEPETQEANDTEVSNDQEISQIDAGGDDASADLNETETDAFDDGENQEEAAVASVVSAEDELGVESSDSEEAEQQDQPEAPEIAPVPETKVEQETEKKSRGKKIFRKIALLGLEGQGIDQTTGESIKSMTKSLLNDSIGIMIDSRHGYGEHVLQASLSAGRKITGVYLRPYLSNDFAQASQQLQENESFSILYSNYIERLRHFAKDARLFVVFENTGIHNVALFTSLWAVSSMYLGQHKPLLLVGAGWEEKMNTLQSLFTLQDEDMRAIHIAQTPQDVPDIIADLNKKFSQKRDMVHVEKVVDRRVEGDEKDFIVY